MLSQQTPITLGLVIILISIIAGCVAGYITLQTQVSQTCRIVATLDEQYVPREVLEEKLERINERQARMEVTLDAVAAKVGAHN